MKLLVAAVGSRPPGWVQQGWDDYSRRMPHDCPLILHSIRAEPRKSGKSTQQMLRAEAVRLRAAVPHGALTIALDENGQDIDTTDLSHKLSSWRQDRRDVVFFIGGPDGLDSELKQAASARWKLSSLTLPHPLVRIVLAEQLYRAWSLLNNHPYHRA